MYLLQTWRYLVLDEGHRVRNEDTLTVKALRAVRRGNVLLLTGVRGILTAGHSNMCKLCMVGMRVARMLVGHCC
jgi:hypothetical protein